ncbi:MAG: hypothetical protein QRY72_05400 [Candidatus Rhabdochlamydia sp.]
MSYSWGIYLMKQIVIPLFVFQKTLEASSDGIAYIDATPLKCVSHL